MKIQFKIETFWWKGLGFNASYMSLPPYNQDQYEGEFIDYNDYYYGNR